MLNFMPLAHGTLGSLDEIAAIVVGLLASVFVVIGFLSRKREEQAEQQAGSGLSMHTDSQPETTVPDHYRLD